MLEIRIVQLFRMSELLDDLYCSLVCKLFTEKAGGSMWDCRRRQVFPHVGNLRQGELHFTVLFVLLMLRCCCFGRQ